ncbi:S41 family peptidase [Candidatus Saccharibacteria bacterium]|nr:S41 family peptidase [Candidatus Saccharibacteria bacterium]
MPIHEHRRPVMALRAEQRRTSYKTGLLILGFMLVAGLGYLAGSLQDQVRDIIGQEDAQLDLTSLQQVYSELRANYDGSIDSGTLVEGAKRGMVDALGDDYTTYMSAEETAEFNKSLSGDIGGGVGVEIGIRGDQPTVVRVLRDNPAEEAGVRVGDRIVAVNDESVVDKTVSDVVIKVRGDAGTTVRLGLVRDGERIDIPITRGQVNNPSVYSSIDDGIGVMTISRFDNDTGRLARQAANDFKDAGVRGVVLDMRGNGGGYVDAAKAVAGIWLDDEVVVVEKAAGRVVEEVRSPSQPILGGVPTVVLVDGSSASASEIVAGALRDHGKATLVGQTTFGKGSVQRLVNLSEGSTLKVTIARWYTPSGINISEKGIAPQVVVELSSEDINANRDPQLDAATDELR